MQQEYELENMTAILSIKLHYEFYSINNSLLWLKLIYQQSGYETPW